MYICKITNFRLLIFTNWPHSLTENHCVDFYIFTDNVCYRVKIKVNKIMGYKWHMTGLAISNSAMCELYYRYALEIALSFNLSINQSVYVHYNM